jgi:hypothetical protein
MMYGCGAWTAWGFEHFWTALGYAAGVFLTWTVLDWIAARVTGGAP